MYFVCMQKADIYVFFVYAKTPSVFIFYISIYYCSLQVALFTTLSKAPRSPCSRYLPVLARATRTSIKVPARSTLLPLLKET
jgi:hypothetical protein